MPTSGPGTSAGYRLAVPGGKYLLFQNPAWDYRSFDLDRDVATGDYFYVRHEQSFTLGGNRIGVGRVVWLELVTRAKGTDAAEVFPCTATVEITFSAGMPSLRAVPSRMR